MKRVLFVSVLFLFAICFASSQAYAQGLWTGNVNVFYGIKALDSDDWSEEDFIDVSKHKEFGLNADFGPFTWPICFTFGYLSSKDDDTYSYSEYDDEYIDYYYEYSEWLKLKASSKEIRLGVKKIWEPVVPIRPYIGVGLAMISAEAELTGAWYEYEELLIGTDLYTYEEIGTLIPIKDDDSAIGVWLTGGVYWTIARHFNIGLELGYSKAEVSFDTLGDMEAGGIHYGLFAGYHW